MKSKVSCGPHVEPGMKLAVHGNIQVTLESRFEGHVTYMCALEPHICYIGDLSNS